MGKKSQTKGRGGELELAKILQGYDYPVEPGMAVSYGRTPDLTGLSGIHIECKRQKRLNITDAMNQAVKDSERFGDGMPAVFHRKNREPWLVTMRLSDWIKLYGLIVPPPRPTTARPADSILRERRGNSNAHEGKNIL